MSLLIVQLTYGATALTDPDGIFFDRLVRGAPGTTAEVRGQDDIVAGAPGRFARNRVKDRRVIEARGWVTGAGATPALQWDDYWDNRVAAGLLFDPTVTRVLQAVLGNGATYTINARSLPSPDYNEMVPMHADAAVQWESLDPDWVAS